MKESDDILVSVVMLCYNHEKYIKKAIESVISQKTTFKIEIVIHDDASTDNSATIIKEYEEKYPDVVKPIYQKENQYKKGIDFVWLFIYPRIRGKYVAQCECDDFWCAHDKLQKQVDCLEKHKEYIACSHNCNIVDDNDEVQANNYSVYHYLKTHVFDITRFECGLFPGQTAALMFRKEVICFPSAGQETAYTTMRCQGDQKLAIHLLLNGKIYYMEEIMSSHRVVNDKGESWTARMRGRDMALYMFCASRDLRHYAREYYGYTLHNHYVTFHRGFHILLFYLLKDDEEVKKNYQGLINEMGSIGKAIVYIIAMGFQSFPFFIIQKLSRKKYDIRKS